MKPSEAYAKFQNGEIKGPQLMRSVNLTHGGFYGHFESRAELLTLALERALIDGSAASRAANAGQANPAAFIRGYLSRAHRDSRKNGCAVAALASDVARADEPDRQVMERYIERLITRVASALDAGDEEAMFATSAMVGGLLLSRVFTDAKRSDAMLKAVRNGLAAQSASEK